MHLTRRKLRSSLAAALAAAAVCGFAGVAVSTPEAHASTRALVTRLPGFGQVVVDMAASRVFVSEGTNASSSISTTPAQGIVVTDLSGNYLTTIDEGTGAQGLALAPDGTLFAALSLSGKVAQIDPVTYSETDYPLPDGDVPGYVAAQSGKIWVSYEADQPGADAFIGEITPGSTSSFQDSGLTSPAWLRPPKLVADPGNGGIAVAVEPDQVPATVASFDVSGTVPVLLAENGFFTANCAAGISNEVAVLPGGRQFILACGNYTTPADAVFSTADLSLQPDSYPTLVPSNAVAVAPDGAVATGGLPDAGTPAEPADMNVFSPGSTTPAQSYTEGVSGSWKIAPGGLAWGDSSILAVVMAAPRANNTVPFNYQLRVITDALLDQSALTMNPPLGGPLGTAVNVSGSLTINGAAAPEQTVTISRSINDGPPARLGQATTDSSGNFTFSDTPTAPGKYTYTASFAGDPGTAPDTVTGQAAGIYGQGQVSLHLPSAVVAGQSFEVTGTLTSNGAPAAGKAMHINRVSPDGTDDELDQAVTDSDGAFTFSDTLPAPGSYYYYVQFFGDWDTGGAGTHGTVVALEPAQIALKLPPTSLPGQPVDASGSLAFASGAPASGKTVTVTRTGPDGTATLTVTTGTKGTFSFRDNPSATGTYTYTARYTDSATGTVTGQASVTVTVARES